MLTWRLWHLLRNPPFGHPLFRRTLVKRASAANEPQRFMMDMRFVLELLGSLFLCSAMLPPFLMLLAAGGVFLILNGTIYSLIWSWRASGVIAQERAQGTYDLYCVSPEGALGVNWAIFTGCLHRNRRLEQIHTAVRSLLMAGLMIILVIVLMIVVGLARPTPNNQLVTQASLLTLIHAIALLTMIYIDHIQSIVAASLVSILLPTYARGRFEAQLGTFGVYLMLQVTTYLLAWLVCLVILPALFRQATSWPAQISLTALQVAAFYGIREIIIILLWEKLKQRLNVAPAEPEMADNLSHGLGFKLR